MANFGGGSGVYGGKLAEECRSMKQIGDFSPMGLRVLVVDDDKLCLKVLEGMLRQCNYEVTTCCKITQAITMVKEGKDDFDLVMCEVYMPGEDGFELLEIVGLGLDLPVIMMSTNGDTTVVMKGITHGACDYLIKPIRIEALRNIWQHVLRRRGRDFLKEEIGECEDREAEDSPESSSRKRKDSGESGDEVIDDISSLKRARVHWTVQLHQQFVAAVNQLGIDKAVPKKIVEIMKVHGLSRENVASHLQKYRLYLKRLSGVVPEPYPVASFQAADDSVSGGIMKIQLREKGSAPSSVVKGLNLGAGVNSNVGVRGLDKSTLTSLEQYRAYQQKLAANRAQVYGGLGICPSKASNAESFGECSKNSKNGLQRMCSVDLGLLWKVQQEQDEEKNNKLVIAGSGMPGLLPSGHKRSRENITLYDQLFEEEKSVRQLQSKRPIASEVAQTFQSTNVVTEYQNPVPVKSKLKNVDEMQPMEDISWISDAFKPESPKPMPAGPRNPLHRMSSIDMGLLWKVQQEQVAENNVKQDISLNLKQYARHLNVRSRTESVGSQSQVSGNLPTAPIQSATPAGDSQSNVPAKNPVHVVGEMHSLEDMSWLDEPFRPVSPRIDHSSGNLFDNFGQEGLGGQVSGPNANEANRQGFSELGLSDISDYLMDDYNPNNK